MSRSFHQSRKAYRNTKCPNSILSEEIIDGKKILKSRKIKTKPYGRKDFIGYGEEEYSNNMENILLHKQIKHLIE